MSAKITEKGQRLMDSSNYIMTVGRTNNSHWMYDWYNQHIMGSDKGMKDRYYNGIWFDEVSQQLPDRVFFNDKKKATTLLVDDVPTVVKTTKGDKYDRKLGFLLAYFQAYSGLTKTQANKYIEEIVKDE